MKLVAKVSTCMGFLTALMVGLVVYFIVQLAGVNDLSREISYRQLALMKLMGEVDKAASEDRKTRFFMFSPQIQHESLNLKKICNHGLNASPKT